MTAPAMMATVTGLYYFGALYNSTAVATSDTDVLTGYSDLTDSYKTAIAGFQAVTVGPQPSISGKTQITVMGQQSNGLGYQENDIGTPIAVNGIGLHCWRLYQNNSIYPNPPFVGEWLQVVAARADSGTVSHGEPVLVRSTPSTTSSTLVYTIPQLGQFADGTIVMISSDRANTYLDVLTVDPASLAITVGRTITVPGVVLGGVASLPFFKPPTPVGDRLALFDTNPSNCFLVGTDGSVTTVPLPSQLNSGLVSSFGAGKALITGSSNRAIIDATGTLSALVPFDPPSPLLAMPPKLYQDRAYVEPTYYSAGTPRTDYRVVADTGGDAVPMQPVTDDIAPPPEVGYNDHYVQMALQVGDYAVCFTQGDYQSGTNYLYLLKMPAVGGAVAPSLRLTQRNDGRGVDMAPRLSVSHNASTSTQTAVAPRVGDSSNRYR